MPILLIIGIGSVVFNDSPIQIVHIKWTVTPCKLYLWPCKALTFSGLENLKRDTSSLKVTSLNSLVTVLLRPGFNMKFDTMHNKAQAGKIQVHH